MSNNYYKAYDERYKTVHSQTGLAWAGDKPTTLLKDVFIKYNLDKDSKILEIGCGEGQNAIYLQQNGFNVLASDVSQEAINWCKQKASEQNLPQQNYFVLDILDNDLEDKFDFIYSVSTLHMLVLDEHRKQFFDFIHSHLNDNGKALITVMGDGEFERNTSDITKAFDLEKRDFANGQTIEVAGTTCRIVNWDTLTQEVNNSNLKVIESFVSEQISGFNQSMVIVVSKR